MEVDVVTMIRNIASNDQFYQFLHNAVDEQIDKNFNPLGQINNDVDWSEENQALARKYFQNIFRLAATDSEFNIKEYVSELGNEKVILVEDCFKIRKQELCRFLHGEMLAKLDKPVITDFDWKVKWIIGSSALSSIREPIVQIDLHTSKIKGMDSESKAVNFEMNLSELNNFIEKLENSLSKQKQ